jgi:uncharacterized protein (DUF58 family)
MILSADDTRRLDRLALASAHTVASAGARQSRARGAGLEFEDYRPYHPGDDPRTIDWTVAARQAQLVVRVFRAEGHLRLHLLLDVSRSMGIGTPTKLLTAARAAAALAYVAGARRDAAGLATFDDRIRTHLAPDHGKAHLLRVLAAADAARTIGRTDANAALTTYAAAMRGPGQAVVLSDFLASELPIDGLKHLAHRGLAPVVMQVLATEDLDPAIAGPTEIADAEDPARARLTDPDGARGYQRAVRAHAAAMEDACRRHGWPYLHLTTDTPFPDWLAASTAAGLLTVHG